MKKVKPRRTLYYCSRIRVGEDSPRELGDRPAVELRGASIKKHLEIDYEKAMQQIRKLRVKCIQNGANIHDKSIPKSITPGNLKLQAGKCRQEAGKWRSESGKWRLEAG